MKDNQAPPMLPEAITEAIERAAAEHHKAVEGEYGCGWPQVRCPGVLRLIDFATPLVALALSHGAAAERARIIALIESRRELSAYAGEAWKARRETGMAKYHGTIIGVCDGILSQLQASHPPPTPEEP